MTKLVAAYDGILSPARTAGPEPDKGRPRLTAFHRLQCSLASQGPTSRDLILFSPRPVQLLRCCVTLWLVVSDPEKHSCLGWAGSTLETAKENKPAGAELSLFFFGLIISLLFLFVSLVSVTDVIWCSPSSAASDHDQLKRSRPHQLGDTLHPTARDPES